MSAVGDVVRSMFPGDAVARPSAEEWDRADIFAGEALERGDHNRAWMRSRVTRRLSNPKKVPA